MFFSCAGQPCSAILRWGRHFVTGDICMSYPYSPYLTFECVRDRTGSGIYGTFDPEGDAEKKNKKLSPASSGMRMGMPLLERMTGNH
eukprot:3736670-Rhodomonas_salina.1